MSESRGGNTGAEAAQRSGEQRSGEFARGGGGGVDTSWPDDIAGASRAAGYAGYGKGPADSCKHGKK